MAQEWFYAKDGKSVGPLSFDALIAALRRVAEPGEVLVWHDGLTDWKAVRDIPELAGRFASARPVIAAPDPTIDRWTSSAPAAEVIDDDDAPDRSKRRLAYLVMFAVLAAVAAAVVIYAPRAARVTGEGPAPIAPVAAPAPAPAPEQPKQEVVRQDPATILTQLTEKATQAAAATDAIARKLWASIEPEAMQKPPNYASASRSEIEDYLGELETAEANAVAARSQYAALLKAEHDLIEEAARASGLAEGEWTELLAKVDERHGAALELATRMLQARGELYRAMQVMQAMLIDQFGKYKASADGQIQFSNKAASDRMVAVAEELNAASRALDRIEDEMMKSRQVAPQAAEPAWKDMIIKDQMRTPQ